MFRDDLARGVGRPRSFITVKVAAVAEVLVAFERQITVTSSSLRTHLNPTCRKQAEFERVSKLRRGRAASLHRPELLYDLWKRKDNPDSVNYDLASKHVTRRALVTKHHCTGWLVVKDTHNVRN